MPRAALWHQYSWVYRASGGEKRNPRTAQETGQQLLCTSIATSLPKCLLRAKHCSKDFLHNPSFNVGRNRLDFSGMGVMVVPKEPSPVFNVRIFLLTGKIL